MMSNLKKPNTKYTEQEVRSIVEEIREQDKEIKQLQAIIKSQRKIRTPREYMKIMAWSFVGLVVSGLPVFAYGRNAWQMTAYYINKALWETKEYWY